MRNSLTIVILAVIATSLALVVLWTGGGGGGGSFEAGNFYFDYSASRKGILPEKLDYLIISAGIPVASQISFTNGVWHGSYRYRDGAVVEFPFNRGQTLWIGLDRKPVIVPSSISIKGLQRLRSLGREIQLRAASFEELHDSISKLTSKSRARD